MNVDDITIEVRSLALGRLGQIDLDYVTDLEIIKRFNNVGSWSLTLPAEYEMAQNLASPGRGIIVTGRNNVVLLSGPLESWQKVETVDDPIGTYVYNGTDDNVFLADALVFPEPGNPDPATQSVSHWTNSGASDNVEGQLRAAFTANIGAAAHADRKPNAYLHLTADTNLGPSITVTSRFDVLGKFMSDTAARGGLGFDVHQDATGLGLYVYEPSDKSDTIRMDIDNDQISKTSYGFGVPKATRAIVAGQGEGTDRQFVKVTSADSLAAETAWGRKREFFKDRRDTDDTTELTEEGESLVGGTLTSLSVVPSDEVTMVYAVDWFLGDIVAAVVDGDEVKAVVTEAIIRIDSEGVTTAATIGDPVGFDYESRLIAKQQDQENRLALLEKNNSAGGGGGGSLPVGAIIDIPYGMATPAYALDCVGGTASRSVYGSLFGAIGTFYGAGDGSTTFGLPDFDNGPIVFQAMLTADYTLSGAAVWAKIPFTTELVDPTGVYNAASSRFTAPVAGVYEFSLSALTSNSTTGPVYALSVNGATPAFYEFAGYSDSYAGAAGTRMITLAAGDYVEAWVSNANNVTVTLSASYGNRFSGKLLSPREGYDANSPTRKVIIATDQGTGVTVINGGEGYTLGLISDYPTGVALPANHLAMGQTVLAATYSGLAALKPSWVSGANLILPPDPTPRPLIGSAFRAYSSTLLTTSYADVASLTLTAPSDGGVVYISGDVVFQNASSGADRYVHFKVLCDGVLVEEWTQLNLPINGDSRYAIPFATQHTPAAGSHTWKIQAYCTTASAVNVLSGFMRVEGAALTQKIICVADTAGEYSPTVQAALTTDIIDLLNREALVRIKPASLSYSGGTAPTVDAFGRVTMASNNTVSFNTVFTSEFTNYLFVWNIFSASADAQVVVRYRVGTTDETTGYAGAHAESNSGGAFANSANTTEARIGRTSAAGGSGETMFFGPALATQVTRTVNLGCIDNSAFFSIGGHRLATAKATDGFTFYGPSGMLGTLEVYGIRG